MKQTAIDFLYKALEGIRMDYNQKRISAEQAINSRKEVLESAKEMENKNLNDRLDAIYEVILQLHNNEEITGFSKRAYAQCLDIVEQFKNKQGM